jgi:hypothetical protein
MCGKCAFPGTAEVANADVVVRVRVLLAPLQQILEIDLGYRHGRLQALNTNLTAMEVGNDQRL